MLSTFISPHCGQPPVPRSLAGNPLAFHDALNVAGIGEEADGVVNGKWGLWCDCPHHHIGSRGTVAAKPSIMRVFVRHKGLMSEDGGFVMVEKISHGPLPSNGATPNRARPPFTRPTPMVSRAITFPRRVDNRLKKRLVAVAPPDLMGAGFVFDRSPECARSGAAAYTGLRIGTRWYECGSVRLPIPRRSISPELTSLARSCCTRN